MQGKIFITPRGKNNTFVSVTFKNLNAHIFYATHEKLYEFYEFV